MVVSATVVLIHKDQLFELLSNPYEFAVLTVYAYDSWENFCETFDIPEEIPITSVELLKHIAKKYIPLAHREALVEILADYDLIFASNEMVRNREIAYADEHIDLFDAFDKIMCFAEGRVEDIFEELQEEGKE